MTEWYAVYFCPYDTVVQASQQHPIDYKLKALRYYIPNRSTQISRITINSEHDVPQTWPINYTPIQP